MEKLEKSTKNGCSIIDFSPVIVEPQIDDEKDTYVFYDLLIDVLIYPDNQVKVVDATLGCLRRCYGWHGLKGNRIIIIAGKPLVK